MRRLGYWGSALAFMISRTELLFIAGRGVRVPPIVVPVLVGLFALAARSGDRAVVFVAHVFTILAIIFRENVVVRTPLAVGPVTKQNTIFWFRADAFLTIGGLCWS